MSDEGRRALGDEGQRASLLTTLDEVEIEIEKLIAGGDGFGRIQGLPVFVPDPSTSLLLAIGLAGLAAAGRWRLLR